MQLQRRSAIHSIVYCVMSLLGHKMNPVTADVHLSDTRIRNPSYSLHELHALVPTRRMNANETP